MKHPRASLLSRLLPLAAAALALCGPHAHAQSLLALYESARGYDASFVGAKAQFEANLAKANQALGGILPNIALSTTATRTYLDLRYDRPEQFLPGTPPATTPRTFGTYSGAVLLNQPLYRPAAWAAYRQGGQQLQLAAAQFEAAEQDLLVRVSQAYFDVLNGEDTLSFVQAQKKAVAEQLAAAKRNFEVGATPITGVRDAQARYDLTLTQEIAAENDLRVKRLALDLLVGQSNAKPLRLRTVGPLVDAPKDSLDQWVSTSEANSPLVRQAQLALDVARLEIDKAMAGHKPTVDAQIAYAGTRNISGNAVSSFDTHVFAPYAQVVMSVPLFSGYATTNRVKETKALESKAQADLEAARRSVAQATRSAYLGVMAGLSQVKAYESAEASTQSSVDANRLGYSVGVNISIDVLNAQSQLFQTKRDLAKARYDLLMTHLKLRQAAGTLTPQDLEPINGLLAR